MPQIPVAIYRRVSSEEQARPDKPSLTDQLNKCVAYATAQGWEVIDDFCEPGITGEEFEERPALQKLLAAAREGKFKACIVYDGDRIGRRFGVSAWIYDILEYQCDVAVVDLLKNREVNLETFDASEPSRVVGHAIDAISSHLEQHKRRLRSVAGRQERAIKGYSNATRAPFGYIQVPCIINRKPGFNLEPDPQTYHILSEIRDRFLFAGESILSLARWLEGRHQSSGDCPPMRSAHWTDISLKGMLQNPFYGGKVFYGKYQQTKRKKRKILTEGVPLYPHNYQHPWTWEEYQQIQAKLALNSYIASRVWKNGNPLSGVLKCGVCGGPMVIHYGYPKWTSWAYRCNRTRVVSHNIINHAPLRLVLPAVLQQIDQVAAEELGDPVAFYEARNRYPAQNGSVDKEINRCLKELEDIPNKFKRVDSLILKGILDDADITRQLGAIKEEQERLTGLIAKLEQQKALMQTLANSENRLASALDVWREIRPATELPVIDWPDELIDKVRAIVRETLGEMSVISVYDAKTRTFDIKIEAF